jgi:hypothetical protein
MQHEEQLDPLVRSVEAMSGPQGVGAQAPRGEPTPRAQMARVVVGATLAVVLGAGPAVAWDVSTQLPRGEAPSHWAKASPWRSAGKHVKSAAVDVARVYLPRSRPSPVTDEESSPAPPAPVAASAPAAALAAPPATAPAAAAVLDPLDLE